MRWEAKWMEGKWNLRDKTVLGNKWPQVCTRKRLWKMNREGEEGEGKQSHTWTSRSWGNSGSLVFLTGHMTRATPAHCFERRLPYPAPGVSQGTKKTWAISVFEAWSIGFRALLQGGPGMISTTHYHHHPRTWEWEYPLFIFLHLPFPAL